MHPLRGGALIAITLGVIGLCAEYVRVTYREMIREIGD